MKKDGVKEAVMSFRNAAELLDVCLRFAYFHPWGPKGSVAIPFVRGDGGSGKLVIVTGENASGKSFFRRIVRGVCGRVGTECIHISMESRAGDGSSFGGLRSFVYGDENQQSTGENSVGTVLGGIRTCQGREGDHVMVWDEPDLGLSDGWAAGMGETIRDFAREPGKRTVAIVLVTHRRALLQKLLGEPHHFLHLGAAEDATPRSLEAWMTRPIRAKNIERLAAESRKRWRAIEEILQDVDRRRRDEERT